MFVLVVGAGRVGSSVATAALRAGHTVSVLDEDPLSHERLDVELGQGWEEAGGRFTIGTALEMDALIEAGIEEADVFIASTNGDNTNLVVSQIAQRRFDVPKVIARVLDPRRAAWYAEQGLQTICPTQIAIEQLAAAALAEESDVAGLYVIIAGAGKVGWNLARELIEKGHEVTVIEQDRRRYLTVEQELEHAVQYGDATELWVLERAGHPARRPRGRGHRRRRGQPPDLPGREGEVPLRAHHRPRQQPAEPRALQAAGDPARGLGDRPDPAPDRARGPALRARAPARPARGAAGDHRAGGLRHAPGGGQDGAGARAARRRARDLGAARRRRASCPRPTRSSRPGDEVLVVLDPGLEEEITAQFVADGDREG